MRTITLKLTEDIYNSILAKGIDISKYICSFSKQKMDETEYLLSTENNKKELLEAIEDVKNKKNLVEINIEDL